MLFFRCQKSVSRDKHTKEKLKRHNDTEIFFCFHQNLEIFGWISNFPSHLYTFFKYTLLFATNIPINLKAFLNRRFANFEVSRLTAVASTATADKSIVNKYVWVTSRLCQ